MKRTRSHDRDEDVNDVCDKEDQIRQLSLVKLNMLSLSTSSSSSFSSSGGDGHAGVQRSEAEQRSEGDRESGRGGLHQSQVMDLGKGY